MNPIPTFDDVIAAAGRLAGHAHRTPALRSRTADALLGAEVFFKCESLQRAGAFKFRGAFNALSKFDAAQRRAGVVAFSSGNHAQAVALAGRVLGIPATILMPNDAPQAKVAATQGYGAEVIRFDRYREDREALARDLSQRRGLTLIPPYDHADVIAGQGTLALELLEQAPDLDAIIAPVGGGGLLAGIAIAATALRPGIRIFGAEPQGADDAARSKQADRIIPLTNPDTIADGLVTSLGELTWPVLRDRVEAIETVTDAETIAAMRFAWERGKLLIEPSAAVALAAVLGDSFRSLRGIERVGVVLSGGNVDLDRLPW